MLGWALGAAALRFALPRRVGLLSVSDCFDRVLAIIIPFARGLGLSPSTAMPVARRHAFDMVAMAGMRLVIAEAGIGVTAGEIAIVAPVPHGPLDHCSDDPGAGLERGSGQAQNASQHSDQSRLIVRAARMMITVRIVRIVHDIILRCRLCFRCGSPLLEDPAYGNSSQAAQIEVGRPDGRRERVHGTRCAQDVAGDERVWDEVAAVDSAPRLTSLRG